MRLAQDGQVWTGHPPATTASPPWAGRNLFRLGLTMVIAAVLLAFVGVGQARADTITVCKTGSPNAPCNYETIQAAVDAADPGDTIDVKAGEYNETVAVDVADLTLNGEQSGVDARDARTGGESIVGATGAATQDGAFNVTAGGVTIDGFTVQNASGNALGVAIYLSPNQSGYTILNNIFQNNTFGLYLNSEGTNPTLVKHNLFRDNNLDGAASGNGIYADQGSKNINVNENKFVDNDNAAMVFAGNDGTQSNLSITDNDISDSGTALINVSEVDFVANNVRNSNGSGVFLAGADEVIVEANSIEGSAGAGVRLRNAFGSGDSTNVDVIGNDLTGNDYGIRVAGYDGSSNPLVANQNRIFDNSTAGIRNDVSREELDAENNWWGCNEGPNADGCDTTLTPSDVDADPWLVLDVRANPGVILTGGATSEIEARLLTNKGSGPVAARFPDGVVVDFATDRGDVDPDSAPTNGGVATTTLTSGASEGTANVSASLDAETVNTQVTFTDCTIRGNSGDNELEGTPGPDVICGFGGNDTIEGRGGGDELRGGGGNDTLSGNGGNDLVLGGLGADRLFANIGEDDLYGQGGQDFLNTGDGDSNDLADGGINIDTCQTDPGDTKVSCER